MSKRRLAWAAVAALIAIPAGLYGHMLHSATASLRLHAADLEAIEARFRARAQARPCDLADPLPEDGSVHAHNAWELLVSIPHDARQTRFGSSTTPPRERVLETYRAAVDHLRQALRRRPSPDRSLTNADSDRLRETAGGILDYAEALRLQGRDAEAFEAVLLHLGFARDYAWSWGDLPALREQEEAALDVAATILLNHGLNAGQLGEILERLERLERSRPTLMDEIDLRDMGSRGFPLRHGIGEDGFDGVNLPRSPSWRTAWSLTVAHAAFLGEIREHHERLREIASLPWPERVPAAKAYLRTVIDRFNDDGVGAATAIFLETEAAAERDLLRAALLVAKHEAEHGRFPAAVPGNPLAPDTGKPYEVYDDVVRSEHETGVRSIRVRRR
jgi:hypothetical protein